MSRDSDQLFLHPGDAFVANGLKTMTTVLGSCVSVILWDEYQRVGGMNHFLLPRDKSGGDSCRYGDVAVLRLLRMMQEYGCKRGTICAQIAGGASPVRVLRNSNSIGAQNVFIAKEILRHHRIPILREDTGGATGYRIRMNTLNGEVVVRAMSEIRLTDWYDRNGMSIPPSGNGRYPFERRREEPGQIQKELTRSW